VRALNQRCFLFLCGFLIFFGLFKSLEAAFDKTLVRRSIVSIRAQVTDAAYDDVGTSYGTGFVCDAENGIVLTNQHVAGYGSVGVYELTFYNGQKLMARLLYRDPWHDFAFLEIVSKKDIPKGVRALSRFRKPQLGENVFMMGSNQGQGFSFQEGRVNNLYQDMGAMPSPSFSFTLNSRGGSSGSPLLSESLDVLGLNYAGNNQGIGFSLHVEALKSALDALSKGHLPHRYHCGLMVRLVSMQEPLKSKALSFNLAKYYMRMYPDAGFRVLKVVGTLKGSPAEKAGLLNGDILWSVNGIKIGPSMARMDMLLNASQGRSVMIGIYRKGRYLEKEVATYNLHHFMVSRLLVFGGATFFEADDQMRWQFNLAPRQLMVRNVTLNSALGRYLIPSFVNKAFAFQGGSVRLCGVLGYDFDTWAAAIPFLVAQKNFQLNVRWLLPVMTGFSGNVLSKTDPDWCTITYVKAHNISPKVVTFSFEKRAWEVKHLLSQEGVA